MIRPSIADRHLLARLEVVFWSVLRSWIVIARAGAGVNTLAHAVFIDRIALCADNARYDVWVWYEVMSHGSLATPLTCALVEPSHRL